MGKLSKGSQPRKKRQRQRQPHVNRDYLNQLPDEIMINILSRIWEVWGVKAACRTALVSPRFEKLYWTYIIGPNIKFSYDYLDLKLSYFRESENLINREKWEIFGPEVDRQRHLFAGLLTKVLKCYQKPVVDEFVINFYLNSSFSSVIDECLKFAFSKGVKLLHLDFAPNSRTLMWETPYEFPNLHNLMVIRDVSAIHFNNLRDLSLKYVSINQEAMDALLSTCPLLETLYLRPQQMARLKIAGQTLKLKHLSIALGSPWFFTWKIEISAPNLISIYYHGCDYNLHLNYVPLLSEFWATGWSGKYFLQNDPQFLFIFQLKKLQFLMNADMVKSSISYPLAYPEFLKLEQLELNIIGSPNSCLLWPILLIKASPLLHTFTIKFSNYPDFRVKKPDRGWRRIREATKFRHQSLKMVVMGSFTGFSNEIEFAQHLLNIDAPSLEKVVIDTCLRYKNAERVCNGLVSSVPIVIHSTNTFDAAEAILKKKKKKKS